MRALRRKIVFVCKLNRALRYWSESFVVAGANRHDKMLLAATLDGIVVARPEPSEEARQHLTVDLGYDYESSRNEAANRAYEFHSMLRLACAQLIFGRLSRLSIGAG